MEQSRGIEGKVFAVASVLPNGTVGATHLVLGLPPSPGLVDTALALLKATTFEAGTAPKRCALIVYEFKLV
jgi:hypothetical protein